MKLKWFVVRRTNDTKVDAVMAAGLTAGQARELADELLSSHPKPRIPYLVDRDSQPRAMSRYTVHPRVS